MKAAARSRVVTDAIISTDGPSKPRFNPATRFLSEVPQRDNAGAIEWLKTVGDVYVLAHSRSA